MTHDGDDLSSLVSRRNFLVTSGAAGAAALAGCGGSNSSESTTTSSGTTEQTTTSGGSSASQSVSPLESGGSSTVYPIANTAASYWNANRPASDTEYWPHGEYNIDTEKALADYWAGLYGFEAKENGDPPFTASVALSHSGTGVEKVMNGQIDIGNSSGNVQDELPDRESYESFIDHVVGVDGQPLVVSSEIAEAGVSKITGQQLKDLYKGRITNWSELGGPDREIQVLGRVKGSGTRTSFVSNVYGNPEEETTVANRYGQNQRLAQAVAQADNAISYLALAFLDTEGVTPIALEWEGTTYSYGDDQNGLDSKSYPLSRDLHMYTWEGTSEKEGAFINMILSEFGQDTFVAPNNYFTLGERRLEEERAKLPDQV
ncbi:substrate-binding domain-containing protein [Halarchaeum sp. CBA1220]|uniref:PstS family phosphate ABC transporter substrate-binding protein n=1 Tax=Halarchaeum sp. CBA1220 TaxID=1853682 RepID=UPI000F3A81FD|nr:substrate-binding domain-containing protein [Halarchaeum sp. CBA1220]QLC33789.1 substrate-binding domain-containing protein [Halarchaeum sp. CBA1220]